MIEMFFFQALSGMASKVPFTEDRVALAGDPVVNKIFLTIFSSVILKNPENIETFFNIRC